jgi:centromeric protein E
LSEENSGLHVQNQKLSEEASYAKELASAAAVELNNLAGEVTKLSLQNAKFEKELMAARNLANTRSAVTQTVNGVHRKYNDQRSGRKGRISSRANENLGPGRDELESWSLEVEDLKMELQARKQREAVLETALAEKEIMEEEYRNRVEDAKKRESLLENDLANMWVLVAKLKREAGVVTESNIDKKSGDGDTHMNDPKSNDIESNIISKEQTLDVSKPDNETPKEEPLVVHLKVAPILQLVVFHYIISNLELCYYHCWVRSRVLNGVVFIAQSCNETKWLQKYSLSKIYDFRHECKT